MPWKPRNCVVVPVDFSESSAPAVREAMSMAAAPSGVHVVHVIPDIETVSPGALFGNVSEASLLENAEKHLQKFLSSQNIDGVKTHTMIGDPGTQIVDYALQKKADLIVIPSHGYHGMKHLLLGSVAERVIRHAECPVFVLRRLDAE
ncbi:MAG: universal stress protein [Planctomycetaceae bacterium]